MAPKIYWLYEGPAHSRLGIMARPRGGEWLDDECRSIKSQNVQVLVSLLERPEIYELGLDQEGTFCTSNDMQYLHFPIPDRSLPTNKIDTDRFIQLLVEKMKAGNHIVILCRMGIGRSSIIAGRVMLQLGFPPVGLIANISKARGLQVPDTEAQAKWLLS